MADLSVAKSKAKRIGLRIGIVLLLIAIFGPAVWTYGALHFAYSTGERVGFVQKISQKGWLCKTYEGTMTMIAVPGQVAPPEFQFTVPDKVIYDKIQSFAGHRVSLKYEQHMGIPTSCFGETEYFVSDVMKAAD